MTDDVQSLEIEHKWEMDIFEDQHQRNSKSAREECEKKLVTEKRNTEIKLNSCQDKNHNFEAQMIELAYERTVTINRETRTLHELMMRGNKRNEEFTNTINTLRLHLCEQEKRTEKDAVREIVGLNVTYQKDLKSLKRSNTLLSNEKDILQQRHETMLEDLKELQEQANSQD